MLSRDIAKISRPCICLLVTPSGVIYRELSCDLSTIQLSVLFQTFVFYAFVKIKFSEIIIIIFFFFFFLGGGFKTLKSVTFSRIPCSCKPTVYTVANFD